MNILTESELAALESSSGDDCDMASVQAVVREVRQLRKLVTMYEAPRIVELDWTNCDHNRAVEPDTGECLDCGMVLP